MYTFAQPLTQALTTAPGACAGGCQDSRRTFAELGGGQGMAMIVERLS